MSEPTAPDAAGSLFDQYTLGAAWDEMLAEPGAPRTAYKPVFHTLRAMNAGTLKERADTLARSYLDQGVTFDFAGEERPFPLDAVPRVISAHEWQIIESGVVQRVTALEAFLADIYSREGEIPRAVHDGVIPWRLIASSQHFHRAGWASADQRGARPRRRDRPDPRRGRHLAGARGQRAGAERRQLRHLQPPGDGQRLARGVRDDAGPPGGRLPAACCSTRCAPRPPTASSDPTVVVLTPGVYNSAYFEHTLLGPPDGRRARRGSRPVLLGGAGAGCARRPAPSAST